MRSEAMKRAQAKYAKRKREEILASKVCGECRKVPARPGKRFCQECAERSQARTNRYIDQARVKVLELLGGRCACQRENCWHEGQCLVSDTRILTVDHYGSTRLQRLKGAVRWLNYLKEIKTGILVQLLCPNCHHMKDTRRSL